MLSLVQCQNCSQMFIAFSRIVWSRARLCTLMSRPGSQGQTDTPASLCIRKAAAGIAPRFLPWFTPWNLLIPPWISPVSGCGRRMARSSPLPNSRTSAPAHCSAASGVREELQGRGMDGRWSIGLFVRRDSLSTCTPRPEFFRKAGFRDAESQPPDLPPRSIYGCLGCDPSQCRCMMRSRDDS